MEIKDMVKEIKNAIDQKADSRQIEDIKKNIEELELKLQRPTIYPTSQEMKHKYFDGQKAARLWKCQIYAQKEKKSVIDAANEIYNLDEDFVNEVKTLMAGGNAGQLIETQYYSEILPLLYNKTIFDKMGVRRLPMPKGNLTIRKMISGTTAAYIGETKAPKPSFARFASLKLSSKKLSIKTILSNDLIRDASPEADRIVRDDMVMQMRISMDYNVLYGLGTEFTPTGIANAEGVTKVTKSEVIDGDKLYSYMVTPLKKANIPMTNLGWVFNPDVFTILYNETFPNGNYKYRDELKNGRLHGIPFVETNQIATGTDAKGKVDIFLGDFDQFMIGEQMALEVKTSEDASYYDEEGNLQSAFDNDETVIKGLMIHDFGVAYGKAFTIGNFQTIA
ncbi:phage major capsid protein [Clostridium rectalis]|uniref:phage major capsid protein n=1 Tax=Clostridium rectalis TaxID=2040295 RepID=UPI000F62F669|nr:phage major capsid protein [Clostridium rectalis]